MPLHEVRQFMLVVTTLTKHRRGTHVNRALFSHSPVKLVVLALVFVWPHGALAATPYANGMDPRAVAFLRLEMSDQGRSGMLPGGCTWLAHGHVCVPTVTVDGHRLSDIAVLAGDVSEATNPSIRRLRLQSARAIHAGVAVAVFHNLVVAASTRDHIRVSTKRARAFALHELRLYQAAPPQRRVISIIPRGMTAQQYFTSPRMVTGYRREMIFGRERDLILHRYPGLRKGQAFRRWIQSQVPPPHHPSEWQKSRLFNRGCLSRTVTGTWVVLHRTGLLKSRHTT